MNQKYFETFLPFRSLCILEKGLTRSMGVTVQIGNETRDLDDATESWINEQIDRRRRDGASICITVRIQLPGVDLRLDTPACGGGSGGGRQPNSSEQQIINLWNERKLNSSDFSGGNVVAFVKQLRRLI